MSQLQGDTELSQLLVNWKGIRIGTPESVNEWIEAFYASRAQGTSLNTMLSYQDTLKTTYKMELTDKGINDWLNNLKCGNAKLNHYRNIKIYVNWLYHTKKIKDNPMEFVSKPKIATRILPAITKTNLVKLIKAASCIRDVCVLRLFFDSGLRNSELVGIQSADFDFQKGTVTVIGKGDKQRNAPFTIETGELLKEWFSTHTTFELNLRAVSSMLRKLELNTGTVCNPHTFRRGFACEQHKQGRSLLDIKLMGGWSSVSQVERYTQQLTNDDALARYDRG